MRQIPITMQHTDIKLNPSPGEENGKFITNSNLLYIKLTLKLI